MLKRVLALWLTLPPTTQVAAWIELCGEAPHCQHEFCNCKDHCERKPAANQPYREKRTAPKASMADGCHAGQAAQILPVRSYVLPGPIAAPRLDGVVVMGAVVMKETPIRDGFERIDLPPPRLFTS
jgi:hypothetical protein